MTEESPEKVGQCQLKECSWNSDKKCIEGHSDNIENCPNIKWESIANGNKNKESISHPEEEKPEPENENLLNLPSGTAMTISQGSEVSSAFETKVILLLGAVGSGKTTIINTIYEKFLEGTYAGFQFSGSKTLIGFEQICHLSRIASMRKTPDTERTKRELDKILLHLCLRKEKSQENENHILISNISGELFYRGVKSNSGLREIPLIIRADQLVLVFDGSRLLNTESRQTVKHQGLQVLRACVERGYLNHQKSIDVVFSKQDILKKSPNKNVAEEFQNKIKEEIENLYSKKIKKIGFFNVAALPIEGGYEPGYGLDKLLGSWCSEKINYSTKRNYGEWDNEIINEFDKYIWKVNQLNK